MRTTFITETWPPQVNGVALTVRTLAEGLAARGFEVEVVRPGSNGRDGKLDLVCARGGAMPGYPSMQFGLPAGNALRRRWIAKRPHAVYIATEGPLGTSAMRTANALDIPVVTGFHTRFHDYAAHYGIGLLAPLVRTHLLDFHRRAQMTLAPTRDLQAELTDAGIVHVRKLRRGVDTRLFSPERRDPALRRSWGVYDGAPVLLCVGLIAAEKNLGLAVQAFRALHARVPGARIVMVGDGPQRAALAAAYRDALFVGTKHDTELAAHYASADLFVFPSLSETFGNVVLEAMASGLALVAFDHAAAQEHVANGISGLVVPVMDTRGFITSVYQLGVDPETRRLLGVNARRAAQRCPPDAVICEFESMLNSLMRGYPDDHLRAVA
ncbi:MAG TPA: glycosyltransferase family 1 protein [Rhodanobacter sp.]|nr:glycosyltransferase family 1 protein [Rhodanobacter sp.]